MKTKNIIFDVDSTLVALEGLDFIAEIKGKGRQVKELTSRAMNGNLSMRKAMKVKLDIIKPSYFDLIKLGEEYIRNIVPGAREVIQEIKNSGCEVWILTGNFQPAVGILANFLGVPLSNVIANEILFDENGNYVSFNLNHPLSNNNGKKKIIQSYGKKLADSVMVGDSFTDLNTKSAVKMFIGYGGVVKRPIVAKEADIYITEANLKKILPYLI